MSNIHVTIINLALISYTKFYLAWKSFKLEAASICYIVGLTVFAYIYGYLLAIYKITFILTPFGSSCIGNKDQNKINKDAITLNVVAALTTITIGCVYDISLYFFLKHRNQIERGLGKIFFYECDVNVDNFPFWISGQAKIIPWKSSNQEKYKYTIPIGASAIALITAIACCILAVSVSVFIREAFNIVMVVGYVLLPILICVMLALTITSLKWLSDHKRSLSMQFLIGMQFLTMFMAASPISIMFQNFPIL